MNPYQAKPTRLRQLQGNPSRRPYNLDEPQLPTADVSFEYVPYELADDVVAAAEWRRLAPLLRQARIVTEADRNALVAACQQWSIYQHALTQAPPARRVVKTGNDYPIPNPFIGIANKALVHCERLWHALGLTPAARASVVMAGAASDSDPFAEFDQPRARKIVEHGPSLEGRMHVDDDDDDAIN